MGRTDTSAACVETQSICITVRRILPPPCSFETHTRCMRISMLSRLSPLFLLTWIHAEHCLLCPCPHVLFDFRFLFSFILRLLFPSPCISLCTLGQCVDLCPFTTAHANTRGSYNRKCTPSFTCTNGRSSLDASKCVCPDRECTSCRYEIGNAPGEAMCFACTQDHALSQSGTCVPVETT